MTQQKLRDRIAAKVEYEPNTGCWLWIGRLTDGGYGQIGVQVDGVARTLRAHRVSYEVHVGDIPTGMYVCHRCDTPSCVNPAHLFAGTPQDNATDMVEKGRHARAGGSSPGEHHPSARLTEAQVADIRRREKSCRAYAKQYGISAGYVCQLQNGHWRRAA